MVVGLESTSKGAIGDVADSGSQLATAYAESRHDVVGRGPAIGGPAQHVSEKVAIVSVQSL
jgi:hypothetical protein